MPHRIIYRGTATSPSPQQASTSLANCAPGSRCHHWRTCSACAAIRQARIADAADRIAQCWPGLHWTRVTPHVQTARAISTIRARWRALAAPAAGLWTVEQGARGHHLHLNFLHTDAVLTEIEGASTWTAHAIEDHRRVAAYISKREQAPDPASYHGRSFGTFGAPWFFIANNQQAPALAAAALQFAINPGASTWAELASRESPRQPAPLTRADYHAIATRYLPDLIDIAAGRPPQ
jgi:hypothetical protein